jgi:hypothetical protein
MPILLPMLVALSLTGSFPARDRMRSGPFVRGIGASESRTGQSDLDGDRVLDCWSLATDGGSGFGYLRVEVRLGCGHATYALAEESSFGELLSELRPTNPGLPRALASGLARAIYGVEPGCKTARAGCRAIDPAFAWLLDERASRESRGAWRAFTPRMTAGRPTLPFDDVIAEEARGEFVGFVSFAGSWVGSVLVPGARCGAVQLWTTEHGVVVEDRAARHWQWVFLSTGVGKLRWPSIVSASCEEDARSVTVLRRGEDLALERITIVPSLGRWRSEPVAR